jgi:hypothetical protein
MLSGRTPAVQRMMPYGGAQSAVLSGHGRFGDNQLLPANPGSRRSRAVKATFTLPAGVELVIYAPPGAWLENEVANRIESGDPPGQDELAMVNPYNRQEPMPPAYPRTFRAGEEVINYKLTPLAEQHLAPGAVSVGPGTLQEKVHELAEAHQRQGPTDQPLTIHYACCGVGSSNRPEIDRIFEYRNYTVMMRTT